MVVAEDQIREMTEAVWSSVLSLPLSSRPHGGVVDGARFVTGCVQISGGWTGALTLACSSAFARKAAAAMFGSDEPTVTPEEMRDGLGELANMVGGNVKALLPGPSRLSLPTVVEGVEYALSIRGSTLVHEIWLDCEGEPLIVKLLEITESEPHAHH
jgi:chemotaxis protein CheX